MGAKVTYLAEQRHIQHRFTKGNDTTYSCTAHCYSGMNYIDTYLSEYPLKQLNRIL